MRVTVGRARSSPLLKSGCLSLETRALNLRLDSSLPDPRSGPGDPERFVVATFAPLARVDSLRILSQPSVLRELNPKGAILTHSVPRLLIVVDRVFTYPVHLPTRSLLTAVS